MKKLKKSVIKESHPCCPEESYKKAKIHNSILFSNLNFLPNQKKALSKNHELFRLVLPVHTPLIIKEVEFGEIWPKYVTTFCEWRGKI